MASRLLLQEVIAARDWKRAVPASGERRCGWRGDRRGCAKMGKPLSKTRAQLALVNRRSEASPTAPGVRARQRPNQQLASRQR
jgi:hypothetical protein